MVTIGRLGRPKSMPEFKMTVLQSRQEMKPVRFDWTRQNLRL